MLEQWPWSITRSGPTLLIDHSIMGSLDQIMIEHTLRDLLHHDRGHHYTRMTRESLLLWDLDGGGTVWADEEGQRSQREEVCIFCGFVSSYLSYGSIYVDTEGLYSTKYESCLQCSNIWKSFRYPSRASFQFQLRCTFRCLLALYSDTSCRPFIRILIYSTWPGRPRPPPSLIICDKGNCSIDWSPMIFNRAKHRRDDIPFHFRLFLQLSQPARVKDGRHSIPLSSEEPGFRMVGGRLDWTS